MKKFLVSILLVSGLLIFAACNTSSSDVFEATDDIFAFQAITAVELLADQPISTVQQISYLPLSDDSQNDEPIVSDEITVLNKYLSMMDLYLGDNNGLNVTPESSDNPEYTYKITFTSTTLSGIQVVYTLYYNEVLFEESDQNIDEDDQTTEPLAFNEAEDRLRDKSFEFEDEGNVLYVLSGLLIIGDSEYTLEGKRIIDENEKEILIMRSWVDHDNYVAVRYQNEDSQKKFFYEIVENGIVLNRSKIRILEENNKLLVKLEFVEGDAKGKYDFMSETIENITYIKVRYTLMNDEGLEERGMIHIIATYDDSTGETTYEYRVRPENKNKDYHFNFRHEDHRGEIQAPKNPGMFN